MFFRHLCLVSPEFASLLGDENFFSLNSVEKIANFRSGVISSLCLNIFLIYLPGSGKRQDLVYLSSEQGVFNELDFNIVIMAAFQPNLIFILLFY